LLGLLIVASLPLWGVADKPGGILYLLIKWQAGFNRELALKIKLLRDTHSMEIFGVLLATSFFYGVLHAAGPGHGKTIISGWALSQARTLREIALVSSVATFLHAFGAVALVGGIYYFMGRYTPAVMSRFNEWLYIGAGFLLILTGAQTIYAYYQRSHQPKQEAPEAVQTAIHPFWIAASIGIVPCPLSAVIFIFCLSAGLILQGIVFVAAFALGMGVTLFGVAFMVWVTRRTASRLGTGGASLEYVHYINCLSGLFFIILGVLVAWPFLKKMM